MMDRRKTKLRKNAVIPMALVRSDLSIRIALFFFV
jgi:hypothetical protein